MRKLFLTTTALIAFGATAALAELTTDQIAAMFPGAVKIEIQRGLTTTKVEAIVGNEKIEVIFDNATDAELKREVETLTDDQVASELSDSSDDGMEDDGDDDGEDDSDDDGEDDSDDDSDEDESDDDSDDDEGDDDGDDD